MDQMRKIDLHIGGTICLCLEIFERVRRFFFRNAPLTDRPDCILVTKYLGMGSILLATPMLKALRNKLPDSKIVFLTFESNAKFAEQISLIDEVISIRTSSFTFFAKDLIKSFFNIWRQRFDVVFDLEFFARFSTIVSYLSGANIRVGYYLPKLWRGNLLTHQIHFNPYKHVTEVFAAQLKILDVEVTDFRLAPPRIMAEKMRSMELLLKGNGLKEAEQIISVNVNASDLSMERRWPKENFAELITHIVRNKENARLFLVGSKGEAKYVKSLYDALPEEVKNSVKDISGKLDMEEFIALLKRSSLFITNDSGPLHIAASLGTPTVSFFGPESPSLYGPVGKNDKVFYKGIYCSPCLNVYNAKTAMCKGNNCCMKEITPSEVINTLVKEGILR